MGDAVPTRATVVRSVSSARDAGPDPKDSIPRSFRHRVPSATTHALVAGSNRYDEAAATQPGGSTADHAAIRAYIAKWAPADPVSKLKAVSAAASWNGLAWSRAAA